jgi:hypothetical protein
MRGTGVVLKEPVYVMQEPTLGTYIAMRGAQPRATTELHLATIVPATPDCLAALQALASRKLAGIPHELTRVDAL